MYLYIPSLTTWGAYEYGNQIFFSYLPHAPKGVTRGHFSGDEQDCFFLFFA